LVPPLLGTPSAELEHFLLQDLTEKGLKKLGHSIDVSYSNVQRLVLKYLHTVSQALNFHLAEMVGLVRASDKYESVLKVTEESICIAQKHATTLWAKGIELQQVIDESMKCFKAFFRYSVCN
jgi:anaphase-promoting complex subunit 4